MWKKLKKNYLHFIKDQPGQRFINRHNHSKIGKKVWVSAIEIFFAIIFICISILFGLTPLLPGFIFFILAILLLANNSKYVALFADKVELFIRKKLTKGGPKN